MQVLRRCLFVLVVLLLTSTRLFAQPGSDADGADATDAGEDEADLIPSALLEAAAAGDVDAIKAALAEGANIDTTNVNGWSAASFAVSAGKYEALQALIEAQIDLNQANAEGMSPLMYAALQVRVYVSLCMCVCAGSPRRDGSFRFYLQSTDLPSPNPLPHAGR